MDELQISGKRYISSRRIARENGYTADYIGQLIRGGKLAGQKVGRAWYVDAASFDAFLGQEPVKADALVGSPTVTSGQVPSEESAAPSVEVTPVVEPLPVIDPVPVVIETKEEKPEENQQEKQEEQPVRVTVKESGLRYYADEAPLLPEIISSRADVSVGSPTDERRGKESEVFSAERTGGGARRRAIALAVLALIVFVITAVVSSTLALNINVGADNTASTFYTIDFKH